MVNPFTWDFLNEPLYKWFIFFVAMCAFAAVWGAVLMHMKVGGAAA
jgi:hypothetical protein